MDVVSYRGPGMSGGVSSSLTQARAANIGRVGDWWYLDKNTFYCARIATSSKIDSATIDKEVIDGHYRFCNDFLWPIMHGLSQYAHFEISDWSAYQTFNEALGWCLSKGKTSTATRNYFIHDYQLALLPAFLNTTLNARSVTFWHVPWPQHIDERYVETIKKIARSLLRSEVIGFHTGEYAQNFLQFVQTHLEDSSCSDNDFAIWSKTQKTLAHITRLMIAPLGIDSNYWAALSKSGNINLPNTSILRTPFVLSVDRVDYTKGVAERIHAIDRFFQQHQQFKERVSFVQVCSQSRKGLSAYDQYFAHCRSLGQALDERHAVNDWHPLVWIDTPCSAPQLALLYKSAAALLITAIKDGLNLTAKEFVACQTESPGVLELSPGAGSWQELKGHCLEVSPQEADQVAEATYRALTMQNNERTWRMTLLKQSVNANTLNNWWYRFTTLLDGSPAKPDYPYQRLIYSQR